MKLIYGCWKLDENGIFYIGKIDYQIYKEDLLRDGSAERKNTYDYLVHLVEKLGSLNKIYMI